MKVLHLSQISVSLICFSPVAGIILVERPRRVVINLSQDSFSPVAGIILVESLMTRSRDLELCVSVPLPGLF